MVGTRTSARSARWSREDEEAVAEALALTDTLDLADRLVDELSGGQRQRVWIAMALAQQTDLLLLDEPTTYLDVAHQVEVLDLLADLNEKRGTTIVMVLHDLNLAARYADHLVAMREGRIVAAGAPGRGDHRGLRPRGLRDAEPRRRGPRHRHPDGDPAGSPLPQHCTTRGLPEMTQTETQTPAPSVLLTRRDGPRRDAVQPGLRPRRARQRQRSRDLGEDGFDTRFKVLLPGATGALPAIPEVPEDFYQAWLDTPDEVRCADAHLHGPRRRARRRRRPAGRRLRGPRGSAGHGRTGVPLGARPPRPAT